MSSVTTHRSFCRFCEAACAITVDVDGDRVLRVRGDEENPLSRGYTCTKGRSLPDWHHHPDRLDVPEVRGEGGFERRPWTEVLDDLSARLRSLVAEHGPDSVGVMLATGSSFDANGRRTAERLWQRLGSRSVYTSATVDTPCKPFVSRLMSGFPGLVPTLHEAAAGLTVLVGINPVVSHGHLNGMPDPVVKLRALAEGARELWVVDPRRTETARLATAHLAPRPGTDHVLLAHLVREVLSDGADRGYLAAHADAADVATIEALVEPFTADIAARRCDVAPESLAALVDAIRRNGKIAMQTGTGTTMSRTANLTEWLCWVLHVVTGSFDRPGGMWFNPGYLRSLDRRSLAAAGDAPGPGPRSRPELENWLNEFPCAALADEIEAGHLRALVVLGGNPMRALPEPERMRRALEALDTLAVIDVVSTDTTALATHVLPATGQLERADLPLSIDQFVVTLSTQYTPAVVAPGGDRRPSWWILAELAERLDLDVLPGGRRAVETTDDDLLRILVDRSRGKWEELVEQRHVAEAPVFGWVLDDVLPGGRWKLAPPLLVEQFAEVADAEVPSLQLIPRRQVRHLNSQLVDGLTARRADEPRITIAPADAAAAGILDGAPVVVRSAHGRVEGTAAVSDEMREGAVSVPHGYGAPNVCELTSSSADVDPLTGMVLQSGIGVELSTAP